jgi:anti-sigma factor RsiW
MKRACALLDRYRDGELDDAGRESFERHLAGCGECRARLRLLDNLVRALKMEPVRTVDLSARIARRAFAPAPTWYTLVASCFPPRLALAAAELGVLLFVFAWFLPGSRTVSAYTEYEKLLNEAEASNLAGRLLVQNDSELLLQLISQEE